MEANGQLRDPGKGSPGTHGIRGCVVQTAHGKMFTGRQCLFCDSQVTQPPTVKLRWVNELFGGDVQSDHCDDLLRMT
jgi:hypothetical protein